MSKLPDDIKEKILMGDVMETMDAEILALLKNSEDGDALLDIAPFIQALDTRQDFNDGVESQSHRNAWKRAMTNIKQNEEQDAGKQNLPIALKDKLSFLQIQPAWRFAAILIIAFCMVILLRGETAVELLYVKGTAQVSETKYSSGLYQDELGAQANINVSGGGAILNYPDIAVLTVKSDSNVTLSNSRALKLNSGCVWLDVEKNKSGFLVNTGNVQVKVTGTSFGVKTQPDGTKVMVAEGSVEVAKLTGEKHILKAGEGVFLKAESAEFETFKPLGKRPVWVRETWNAASQASSGELVPSVIH